MEVSPAVVGGNAGCVQRNVVMPPPCSISHRTGIWLLSFLPSLLCFPPLLVCWSPAGQLLCSGLQTKSLTDGDNTSATCWSPQLLAHHPHQPTAATVNRVSLPAPPQRCLPSSSALPSLSPPPQVPALTQPQLPDRPQQSLPMTTSAKLPADSSTTWSNFSQYKTGGPVSLFFSGQSLLPLFLPP